MRYTLIKKTDQNLYVSIHSLNNDELPFLDRACQTEYQDGEHQKIENIFSEIIARFAPAYSPLKGNLSKAGDGFIAEISIIK